MTNDVSSRGATWARWDLHVHTPASLVNHYGGDTDEAWDRFLEELENLPADIKAIGINDYWFLDGYRRVIAEREKGRLSNLDVIFPVLEMRLEQFGGTESKLRRVNLHVVFDPALGVEKIEQQFLHALSAKFHINPEVDVPSWAGVITRQSLAELGAQIKASVPETQRASYGSDLHEGFNNLNVSLDSVDELLSSSFLSGRALVGLGKTEWAQIKWNNQSIASKKSIVNRADFVFTAYPDVSKWPADVETLREGRMTYQLLDCSDAHYFSDSPEPERLGNCLTWMNTSLSFEGLKHALKEFDRRVYVGLEPAGFARARSAPENFIESLKVSSDSPERYTQFDYQLALNDGFVAVVGNKGQGKSALLDAIAHAGNSDRSTEYAFLTRSRFLAPSNRAAREYYSEIEWKSGVSRRVAFTSVKDDSVPALVEYLPQAFVERVCTISPQSPDADDFERELRDILFTHIPEQDRATQGSFDDLLAAKTSADRGVTQRLQSELSPLIDKYAAIAKFRASIEEADLVTRLRQQTEALERAHADLEQAEAALAVIEEGVAADAARVDLRARQQRAIDASAAERSKLVELDRRTARAQQQQLKLDAIQARIASVRNESAQINSDAAIVLAEADPTSPAATVVSLVVDDSRFDRVQAVYRQEERLRVAERRALEDRRGILAAELLEVNALLAGVDAERELARQHVEQQSARILSLEGDVDRVDSLRWLESQLARLISAPDDLSAARSALISKAEDIYSSLEAQLASVSSLYQPAARFIADSKTAQNAGLEFDAEIRLMPAWRQMAAGLDGRKSPDLASWIADASDAHGQVSWIAILEMVDGFLDRLECERGDPGQAYRDPATALRSNWSFADLLQEIFGLRWLEVRFGLTGEGRPLAQLSPGQRGLILALFYLVVDLRTTPLLLDQPEENLDNETIATRLVPAIHEAAGRRQTIVVTHNANLAIVGDADQIVHCVVKDGEFTVTSGHISELGVAKLAVNILEGTKPAFDNRRDKYGMFRSLV